MSEIHGTYHDGRVDLDDPVIWPDGARVAVSPLSVSEGHSANKWGIDDEWPDTPENRAEILRRMDAVEPLEMTPEEEAEWHAMLKWFDDYSLQAVKRDMGIET
jgi:hypothetical protein